MLYNPAPAPFYRFKNLNRFSDRIEHFISTRNYLSFNDFTLGMNGYKSPFQVMENRAIVAAQHGFDVSQLVFSKQIHGNRVKFIEPEARGSSTTNRPMVRRECDGMFTHHAKICLASQAADCVPVLLFDPCKNVISCVHSGWRGTVGMIAQNAVNQLIDKYNSNPGDLVVGVGPSIGPCCMEVGPDVVKQVNKAFGIDNKLIVRNIATGKTHFDMPAAIVETLTKSGVRNENIELAGICTKCQNQDFFSHRAGDKGRFGAFIMLKN